MGRPWLVPAAGVLLVVLAVLATGYVLAGGGGSRTMPSASPAAAAAGATPPGSSAPDGAGTGPSGSAGPQPGGTTGPGASSGPAGAPSLPGPSLPAPSLPGLNAGSPPWPPETANLAARLAAISLPALSAEGTALHIHQHLDIFVDGQPVQVPPDIGINVVGGFIAPIHTHDASGVIHVESPTIQDFTLGQFFDIWGVRFDAHCIGGQCDGGGRTLQVFVNGRLVTGDPRAIKLEAHQEIVVALGSASQLPNPVPSSYDFAPGL